MFLSNSRNTHESFGELEKAVETLASRFVFPQHFSFSQTSTCVAIYIMYNSTTLQQNYRQSKENLIKLEQKRKKGRTVYLP